MPLSPALWRSCKESYRHWPKSGLRMAPQRRWRCSMMADIFSFEDFQSQQKFPLDGFQKEAIENISQGHSVVVCAPTGSGKTIVAEYAAMRAIAEGKKLFYTTPLKAL